MTKKDYIIIAGAIRNTPTHNEELDPLSAFDFKVRLLLRLIEAFELDNKRFSARLFKEFINN